LIRIALIPILAPLFLIGWLLAFLGEKKAEAKSLRQHLAKKPDESNVEIGLLPDATEDLGPLEVPLKSKDAARN
jgi:hypothetical protein